jgi:hypothetical protein
VIIQLIILEPFYFFRNTEPFYHSLQYDLDLTTKVNIITMTTILLHYTFFLTTKLVGCYNGIQSWQYYPDIVTIYKIVATTHIYCKDFCVVAMRSVAIGQTLDAIAVGHRHVKTLAVAE